MIRRILPDGNEYYLPNSGFHNTVPIDRTIDEIYNSENPHYYEAYYKLEPGMTVVDAGAYAGLLTLKASKVVGPDGLVIALEPFPAAFKVLAYNVKKNRCKNVVLVNAGLWSSTCWKKLIVSKTYISNTVLTSPSSKFGVRGHVLSLLAHLQMQHLLLTRRINLVEVKLTTLDKLMESLGVKQIDFLKMDIEGSEKEALKSYTKITKGNILSLETHRNLDTMLYSIRKKGYSLCKTHIVPIDGLHSIIHTRF